MDGQLFGAGRKTQRRGIQRRVGLDHVRVVEGPVVGHDVARIRRLVPKATRGVDGAQQAHEHRQRTYRLKTVGVRRQPAHGVKSQWPPQGGGVFFAPGIGPGDGQLKGLGEGRVAQLLRQQANAICRNAGDGLRPFRRAAEHALAQQGKSRHHPRAVGQGVVAFGRGVQCRVATVGNAFGVGVKDAAAGAIKHQFVVRVAAIAWRAFGRVGVKGKQAFALAFVKHHQLRRVGEPLEKSMVQRVSSDQLVQQGHEQRAVGAGLDGNPLVGNGRVAGAHRVDGDEATACALEL